MYRLSIIALVVVVSAIATSPSTAVGTIPTDFAITSEVYSFSQSNSTTGNSSSSAKCKTFQSTMTAFNKALRTCQKGFRCSKDCHAFFKAQLNLPMSDCISNYRKSGGIKLTTSFLTKQNADGKKNIDYCKVCSSFSKIFDEGIKLDKKCRSPQIKIVNGKLITGGTTGTTTCNDDCLKVYTYFKDVDAPSNKDCLQGYTLNGRQATESTLTAFKEKNKKTLEKCSGHSVRTSAFIGFQTLIFTSLWCLF